MRPNKPILFHCFFYTSQVEPQAALNGGLSSAGQVRTSKFPCIWGGFPKLGVPFFGGSKNKDDRMLGS